MARRMRKMSRSLRRQLDTAKGQDWRRKRHKLQGGRCAYCGEPMVLEPQGSRRVATLDHVVPLSRGGAHHWENTAAACAPCNQAKGDMTAEEYAEHLEQEA